MKFYLVLTDDAQWPFWQTNLAALDSETKGIASLCDIRRTD